MAIYGLVAAIALSGLTLLSNVDISETRMAGGLNNGVIEHVHVHQGGQAIVGTVSTTKKRPETGGGMALEVDGTPSSFRFGDFFFRGFCIDDGLLVPSPIASWMSRPYAVYRDQSARRVAIWQALANDRLYCVY